MESRRERFIPKALARSSSRIDLSQAGEYLTRWDSLCLPTGSARRRDALRGSIRGGTFAESVPTNQPRRFPNPFRGEQSRLYTIKGPPLVQKARDWTLPFGTERAFVALSRASTPPADLSFRPDRP